MSIAALRGSPGSWQVLVALIAAGVSVVVAVATSARRHHGWALVAPPVALAAAVLFDVTPAGSSTVVIALLAGAAAGLAGCRGQGPARRFLSGAAAGIACVVAARVIFSVRWALAEAVVATLVASATTLLDAAAGAEQRRRRTGWIIPAVTAVATLALLGWTGANNSHLSWFGSVIVHGQRDTDRVAITFDDGPNATATLAVRAILDRYGVKATFFLVGKALDDRPDIARAMLADGMLLGGHSYHHDQWRWLDPRYPELDRTIDAFRRELGVCPHFYRPPHGQRTPLLVAKVHREGMAVAMWDVSAGDWATDDAALVADRVLRDVGPGSIILLHDGLDGDVGADRGVVVAALPMILDGLHARGLHPVRLDELVGGPGYNTSC